MRRNDGIGDSVCLIDIIDETDGNDDPLAGLKRRLDVVGNGGGNRGLQTDLVPIEITSIVFIEVGDNDDLEVINRDDSRSNVTLVDGSVINFTSVSQQLDPDEPLEDQDIEDVLPGGVSIVMLGRNAGGELVRNRVFWTYTNDCGDLLPIEVGDTIGWLTFNDNSVPPRSEFCPPPSPTTAPTVSTSPTATPTTSSPIVMASGGKSGKFMKSSSNKSSKSGKDVLATKSPKSGKMMKDNKSSAKARKSEKSGKRLRSKMGGLGDERYSPSDDTV